MLLPLLLQPPPPPLLLLLLLVFLLLLLLLRLLLLLLLLLPCHVMLHVAMDGMRCIAVFSGCGVYCLCVCV